MTGDASPLVAVHDLVKEYQTVGLFRKSGPLRAVDSVSLSIARGESVGLVGESGSGKTTLGRLILRLIEPTAGSVLFDGIDVFALDQGPLRSLRRRMQIVFQDPFVSLN
ncbi:MAG: ATP-binding cassette domain-containing protein, partial [Gemmatimonadales bacterium]